MVPRNRHLVLPSRVFQAPSRHSISTRSRICCTAITIYKKEKKGELACLGTSQVLTDRLCPGWVGIGQAWFWAIAPHLTSPRSPDPRDISPVSCVSLRPSGPVFESNQYIYQNAQNKTPSVVQRHEVAGVVTEVGSKVEKFKVGDKVGVGCLVDSCCTYQNYDDNLENYCPQYTLTYGAKYRDGTITYGGYSNSMVADEHFVIRIPDSLALDATAPLICVGITVYSPLRYYGLDKPDLHVGVVGLGGLGHMAVKFAKAFGAKGTMGALDGIIDTVSAVHPLLPLIGLLKSHGKIVMVDAPERPLELPVFPLLAAKHNVKPDIEVIPMDYVNTAMERLLKEDVKYRFVIDIGNTLKV
ncbi:putative mannitol dehydrogenase [Glycine soja]|uniref:Putative mannitol dehydrogenase n=1 Tax=Glycine soja TaxID=3848 RepID=A0A445GGE5_GLYSO|nr:putative mannitol dehydrogenase [Glycine soja]